MPIYRLDPNILAFPDPRWATREGIVAFGGDLIPARLLLAYSLGIFPWFNPGEEILWWCPDPRFALLPADLKVSHSMRPLFNQQRFRVTYNQCFAEVMRACSTTPRAGQGGDTWIGPEILAAYLELHHLGFAHSVEVWQPQTGELVGGLYGVALGKIFFGESMFARQSNASKYGFITLVRQLHELGYVLIDCQQNTRHLGSLGAKDWPRQKFLEMLAQYIPQPLEIPSWPTQE